MEQPDEFGKLSTVASIVGAVAWGLWRVFARVFKRKEKMFTSLEIGGTPPEIRFAARLEALEKKYDLREAKDDERHTQNRSDIRGISENVDRVMDELGEQRKMLMSVVRKLTGMS